MTRYMLDTNMVSHQINQRPSVVGRVVAISMASLCISAISAGELLFGLAKRPASTRLHLAVRELLRRIDVLGWDNAAATLYGTVRADLTEPRQVPGAVGSSDRNACAKYRSRVGDR